MNARTRILWLGAIGMALLPTSCSLLGLDHLDLAHCTGNADCESLNTSHSISPTDCMRYQCQLTSGRCIAGPRDNDGDGDPSMACGGTDCDDDVRVRAGAGVQAHEVCDGVDNDCNGIVDEAVVRPRMNASAVTGAANVTNASFSAAGSGTAGLAYIRGGAGQGAFNVVAGSTGSPTSVQPFGYASQMQEAIGSVLLQPGLTDGCEVASPLNSPPVMRGNCDVSDVAAAPVDNAGNWIMASVNRMGCTEGQLRIGYAGAGGEGDPTVRPFPTLVLRGPPARSNLYLGVDVTSDRGCTGQSQSIRGAARPSVGSLLAPRVSPQALVAFVGAPATLPECGGMTVPVEAIGAWFASGTSGGSGIHWVTGTGNGVPQVLGTTGGGGRPSIAGWSSPTSPGWFVGYGNAAGRTEIRFVGALGAAPMVDTASGHEYTPGPSSPLVMDPAFTIENGGVGPADHVAISVGRGLTSETELGISWQEGCGASPALYFARARFTAGAPGHWTVGRAVLIPAAQPVGAASVAFVHGGFVTSGFARGGLTATADQTGGWVIAWASVDHKVLARRFAELDAALIDEPDIVLSESGARRPQFPFLYPDDPSRALLLRYAYVDSDAGLVNGGDLLCGNGVSIGP